MTWQSPKGTRDFFPADLAAIQHVESAWRNASINAGFDEIEGPMFEHLDLYTVKSGEGIVSELFSFRRAGGDTDYALRPEFTPTLARMAAAKGRSLSVPTKWFGIPSHFRAERPQRGRLREFKQWNVDMLGIDSPSADAEVIATAIRALADLGLTSDDIVVRISHRDVVAKMLLDGGLKEEQLQVALGLLDKREKMPAEIFVEKAELKQWDIAEWCKFDFSIVRGLAYYTGIVFEIHEANGNERAIAGGGRYDGLVEMFGGPSIPAVGFGMGDVVLSLVLRDKGLLGDGNDLLPTPDVFVVSAGEEGDAAIAETVSLLRNANLHARRSYKTTKNVGKLLTEAAKTKATFAVILGEEFTRGEYVVKNLSTKDQVTLQRADLIEHLKS